MKKTPPAAEVRFNLYIPSRNSPLCLTWSSQPPEMHIKMSLLEAFSAAIVIKFQCVDPKQKQQYINMENLGKND